MALIISSDWDDENLRDLGEFTNSFIDDCFALSGVSEKSDGCFNLRWFNMLLVPPVYTNSYSHNLHLTFELAFRLKKAQALDDSGGGILHVHWPN
jgi:hypothetical protein